MKEPFSTEPDRDLAHLGTTEDGTFPFDEHTFTPDIWGYICITYEIESVLDLGCGLGHNLAWFEEYGFEVLGVEGHPQAVKNSRLISNVIEHDFTLGPWAPKKEYDLCVCTEFVEHVEAQFEKNWMQALKKCNYLLFSGAVPGQGGYHHVNEKPEEYWSERLLSIGFLEDRKVTEKLRSTCKRKPALWGRNQLRFFMQRTDGERARIGLQPWSYLLKSIPFVLKSKKD